MCVRLHPAKKTARASTMSEASCGIHESCHSCPSVKLYIAPSQARSAQCPPFACRPDRRRQPESSRAAGDSARWSRDLRRAVASTPSQARVRHRLNRGCPVRRLDVCRRVRGVPALRDPQAWARPACVSAMRHSASGCSSDRPSGRRRNCSGTTGGRCPARRAGTCVSEGRVPAHPPNAERAPLTFVRIAPRRCGTMRARRATPARRPRRTPHERRPSPVHPRRHRD
jgi:hypothetical protein